MKKTLTRTIIVCVAVNLITVGFTFAQDVVSDEALKKEADTVRKEAELARKQAELAQKQAELVSRQIPDIVRNVRSRISIPGWQYSHIGSILVIPAAEMKVENIAAITEDMSVMSRIFDTKLSQAHLTTGRGSWSLGFDSRLFGHNSGAIEAIYLEGYGALFLMKVNALLSPPPQVQQEEKSEEEDADPLWTQMRQEMYAPQDVNRRRRTEQPEEKYDARKVKNLKSTLIKALIHTANIRGLKLDESVVLTVIGKAGRSDSIVTKVYTSGDSRRFITTAPGGAATGSASPTVMTIRAKKSDIDDFAKGQLTFDQFHEKTQLLSYSYLGENLGHGSSPSSWPGATTGYSPYGSSSVGGSSRRSRGRSSGVNVTTGERSSSSRSRIR